MVSLVRREVWLPDYSIDHHGPPQRLPDADIGYAGRHDRAGSPEGAARHVLSLVSAATPARGARIAAPWCRRPTCTASRRERSAGS